MQIALTAATFLLALVWLWKRFMGKKKGDGICEKCG
jgi:hypothetical protein